MIVLIHWNGTEWTSYEYPGWFDDEEYIAIGLNDIHFSSHDNGWAVGAITYKLTGEDRSSGFILKYDGNSWYVFEKHIGEGVGSVFAISEDDVWFEAWDVFGNSNSDLYHWDGSNLEFVNLSGNYGISDIAFGSSDEGLAVGWNRYIYHWDGVDWELVYYGVGSEARGVSYDTTTTAYIVEENRLSRWEDGEYRVLSDDEWGGSYSEVHFSSPDEGWIIGSEWINGELYSYTWHWDGSSWIAIEKPDGMSSYDIFSIDSDNVWIVGEHPGQPEPFGCTWIYIDK